MASSATIMRRKPAMSLITGHEDNMEEMEDERLPVVLGQPQLSASSCSNRDYLLSLQSFRFCLRSLPLIKQLSAGMLE